MMILTNLEIRIPHSYENAGTGYIGKMQFKDSDTKAEVTMPLDGRLSQRILDIVAEEVIFTAKTIATNITANCIATVGNQLENKGVDNMPEL